MSGSPGTEKRLPRRLREPSVSSIGSSSSAGYLLRADVSFVKSISAIQLLVRRQVPLLDAKRSVERLMVGQEVTIDLPMLEDAAQFESELRELGVQAVKEASAAAAEG
jgi:hypothetical protein